MDGWMNVQKQTTTQGWRAVKADRNEIKTKETEIRGLRNSLLNPSLDDGRRKKPQSLPTCNGSQAAPYTHTRSLSLSLTRARPALPAVTAATFWQFPQQQQPAKAAPGAEGGRERAQGSAQPRSIPAPGAPLFPRRTQNHADHIQRHIRQPRLVKHRGGGGGRGLRLDHAGLAREARGARGPGSRLQPHPGAGPTEGGAGGTRKEQATPQRGT